MDQLIPILSIIAYFIYQAYTGYKKEQEKAAKRNPGKPNQPVITTKQPELQRDWLEELLQPSEPKREHVKELAKPVAETVYEKPYVQTYAEPAYESSYKQEKYVPTEKPVSLLAEYRRLSTYDEDGTLKRAKEIRSDKRTKIKRLETKAHEDQDIEWGKNQIHFDLNEAIIMKAILERPYQ